MAWDCYSHVTVSGHYLRKCKSSPGLPLSWQSRALPVYA
jgi:hypothetical protein